MPNLLFQQPVALVLLSIATHRASKLLFNQSELSDAFLLFRVLWISSHFTFDQVQGFETGVEHSRSEILGVEDSDVFFVYNYEQQTLGKKVALVDREPLADVEAIELQVRLFQAGLVLLQVSNNCQLDGAAPSYCQHLVRLISESRTESQAPVKVSYSTNRDVWRSPDTGQSQVFRSNLGDVHFIYRSKSTNMSSFGQLSGLPGLIFLFHAVNFLKSRYPQECLANG